MTKKLTGWIPNTTGNPPVGKEVQIKFNNNQVTGFAEAEQWCWEIGHHSWNISHYRYYKEESEMEYLASIVTENTITIVTNKKTITVPSTSGVYKKVKTLLEDKKYDEAIKASDISEEINSFGSGKVTVNNGVVYYGATVVDNSLTKRIISMIDEGQSVEPLVNFLDNLMSNPSSRAVKELYRFLECNSLPITPDGCFLAYKNVRDNYYDKHSGTFRNMIGDTCEMPRNQVMDDPNQTCSAGLHFCSLEYLKGFWGTSGHTMVVKINPADVVSIPVDYNNSKGRCCKYTVVAEHTYGTHKEFYDKSVMDYSSVTCKDFRLYDDYDNESLNISNGTVVDIDYSNNKILVQYRGALKKWVQL